jgi:hypothetical protein
MRMRISGAGVRWDTLRALHARRAAKRAEEGLPTPPDGGPDAVRIEAPAKRLSVTTGGS